MLLDYYCNHLGSEKNRIKIQININSPPQVTTMKSYMILCWPPIMCLFLLKTSWPKYLWIFFDLLFYCQQKTNMNLISLNMCRNLNDDNGSWSLVDSSYHLGEVDTFFFNPHVILVDTYIKSRQYQGKIWLLV